MERLRPLTARIGGLRMRAPGSAPEPGAPGTSSSPEASLRPLDRFLTAVLAGVGVLALLQVIVALTFHLPDDRIVLACMSGFLLLTWVARRALRRGRPIASLLLFGAATFMTTVLISRFAVNAPALGLTPFVIVAVALPYLSGRRLLGLLVAAWVTAVGVIALHEFVPIDSGMPPAFAGGIRVAWYAVAAALILVLLAAYASQLRASLRKGEQFTSFFDGAQVGVSIISLDGRYLEVNPALCRLLGYTSDELRGRSVDDLVHPDERGSDPDVVDLDRGHEADGPYSVERRFVHADGHTVHVRLVGSVVHDSLGRAQFALGILEDVSELRAAEQRLASVVSRQAAVEAALRALRPAPDVTATAEAVCDVMGTMPGVDLVGVFEIDGDTARPLAGRGPDGAGARLSRALPRPVARRLIAAASGGRPWTRRWSGEAANPFERALIDIGVTVSSVIPLVVDGTPTGLLMIGRTSAASDDEVTDWSSGLESVATVVAAVLGRQISAHREEVQTQARIDKAIATRAFSSVFQPIVELGEGRVVGYEALSRFRDGRSPTAWLREASLVGRRVELECALVENIAGSHHALPDGAWLSINASPAFLQQQPAVLESLSGRDIVVEVTEEEAIEDYDAIRAAVSSLGGRVTLAVDDAGAGYASLQHIVELRPRYVKLDMSLVANIHVDPSRQAMVAGMVHFAAETGCTLIAEGIEAATEAATLRGLGVGLGQGYHFGRPAAAPEAPDVAAPASRRHRAGLSVVA